tara:strand:- start:542 stop:742 length:201 start_codon:yes stop_codon:yes gene_type:complete
MTIKLDYTEIDKIDRELDQEHLADLEIDLHWIQKEILKAEGPRAQKFWENRLAEKQAQIASLKAQM